MTVYYTILFPRMLLLVLFICDLVTIASILRFYNLVPTSWIFLSNKYILRTLTAV